MTKLARLTGLEVIAALKKAGFEILELKEVTISQFIQMAGVPLCQFIAEK